MKSKLKEILNTLWQWGSSASVAAAYWALVAGFLSVVVFLGNALYDWAGTVYWVSEKSMSKEEAIRRADIFLENEIEEFDISYPKITTILPNRFFQSFNSDMERVAFGHLNERSRLHILNYRVTRNSGGILSLVIESDVYYHLNLNQSSSLTAINIDIKNERYLDLMDFFRGEYGSINYAKNIIRRFVEKRCASIFDSAYHDPTYIPRFALHDEHFEFIFSEYEVTPGVCGSFSVDVPYQEFSRLIDYGGPLADKAYPVGAWNAESHRWKLLDRLRHELDDKAQ
ncbi:hypothetical protein [Marinobacter sp.]|uniref:hypothetical protein n=1 Tax=Marinobacter sp. TaxID=50741 RepID=UPI003B526D9B